MHIKPTATITAREQEATPELRKFVKLLVKTDPSGLAEVAAPFLGSIGPRIDLYMLVPALNRFDDLLQNIVDKYNLKTQYALIDPADSVVVTTILDLSRIFIERGSNRGIYSSIPCISLLLKCANSSVITSALNLVSKLLALRYADIAIPSRPTPLRQLPAELLQIFVQQQPKSIEYLSGNEIKLFESRKNETLAEAMARVPQNIDQTSEIVTMIRSIYDENFMISQFYAAAVATLIEDPNIYINSHIIDQILPTSTAPPSIKYVAYDCLRDMCFIQAQLSERKRQLTVPFANMYLVSHFSHILNSMANDAVDVDTTIAFFRLLSQSHVASSVPASALLAFLQQPKYPQIQTAAMTTLYTMLMDKSGNIELFIELQGMDQIIETLADAIARSPHDHGDPPPKLVKVDYELSYEQIQWFKSLFVILSNVLKRKSSPSVVARLLNTQIIHVLVSVISKANTYGWLIVSMCVQILSILLKEEDSIISILLESYDGEQLICGLMGWSDNPYYFPPMFQFIAALLSTERGQQIIKKNNILEKCFDALAKSSLSSYGSLNSVGRGIEDINSASPDLHPVTTRLVIEFIKAVNKTLPATEPWVGTDGTDEHEPPKSSVVLLNVMFMLDSIFTNHRVIAMFLEMRGLDPLLDLICNPAIPFDLSLSKEMYKSDHAFCHTMEVLFSLESDTDYILNTLLGRLQSSAQYITAQYSPATKEGPEALTTLANYKSFIMLLHTFNSMVFSGTSYHTSLVVKHLADTKYDSFFTDIAAIYKLAIAEYSNLILDMSENDIVASWPVSACFNVRYSAEDLEAIEKAKPHVSGQFLYKNYTRCVLNLCFFKVTGIFTSLVADLNKESVLYRCEIESCKLAEQIAEFILVCLEVPADCHFPAYYYRDVGAMCVSLLTGRQGFNTNLLVFFKQRNGIQRLFEVHEQLLEFPEPDHAIRIFLHPAVAPTKFSVYAQNPLFGLYRFMLFESEMLGRSQIATDSMSGFDLQQFYLEVRYQVVLGLANMSGSMNKFYPRTVAAYCDVLKLALRPVKNTLPLTGSQIFDWRQLRTQEDKIKVLVDMGVSLEDATGQLASCQNNLAEAAYRLGRSQYPSLPPVPAIKYREGSNSNITMSYFKEFLDKTMISQVSFDLISSGQTDENTFSVAEPLALIPGISKVMSKNILGNLKLVAVMVRDPEFLEEIQGSLMETDLKPLVLNLDPYAITVFEQIVAKTCKPEFNIFDLEFDKPLTWNLDDSKLLVDKLLNTELTALEFAITTRLLVLLCLRCPGLCSYLMESYYIWRIFEYMQQFMQQSTSAYTRRCVLYIYMLLSLTFETKTSEHLFVINSALKPLLQSNYVLLDEQSSKWVGYLYRSPELLFKVLGQLYTESTEHGSCLVSNATLEEYCASLEGSFGFPSLELPSHAKLSEVQSNAFSELIKMFLEKSTAYHQLVVACEHDQSKVTEFKQHAAYMSFLIDLLRTLLSLHSELSDKLLFDGSATTLTSIVTNLVAYPIAGTEVAEFEEKISAGACSIIYLTMQISGDALDSAETVQAYTERVRIVVDTLNKILVNQFLNVPSEEFHKTLAWRYGLLQQIVYFFTKEIMVEQVDPRISKYSKVPIVEMVIIEKRLISTLGLCLTKLDGGQDLEGANSAELNTNLVRVLKWMYSFDQLDFSEVQDFEIDLSDVPSELSIEIEDEDGHSSESDDDDEDDDIDLEIRYTEPRPDRNPFRNSTLGMFEQNSDDENSDEPQEYDHISDDEVLSDLDEDEEEEEGENFFDDAELENLEEDFDIDAELDLSDAASIDIGQESDGGDGAAVFSDNDVFSDSEAGSDDGQVIRLRRFSEAATQRSTNTRTQGDNYWLQPPLWISPQYLKVEESLAEETKKPAQIDSDGIYLPGIDLPELSSRAFANLTGLLPTLRTPAGLMNQIFTMFSSPIQVKPLTLVDILQNNMWTPENKARVDYLNDLREANGSPAPPSIGSSDSDSVENFEVNIVTPNSRGLTPGEDITSLETFSSPSAMETSEGEDQREEHDAVAAAANDTPTIPGASSDYIVTLGDRQINLTELGIDPLFLEALPDNIRQEFLESQLFEEEQLSSDSEQPPIALEHLLGRITGHSAPGFDGLDLDPLSESALQTIPPPVNSVPTPSTKPENGINDWQSCIDEKVLSSVLRQFYFAHDPSFIDYCVNFFGKLSSNNKLRNDIVKGLVTVFEHICTGKTQQGLSDLTAFITQDSTKHYKPIQYVQQPYENTCDLAAQTGDVLVQLLMEHPELEDPISILKSLLELLHSRIVCQSTPILDWVAELIALVSDAYYKHQPRQQDDHSEGEDEAESDWEDVPDVSIGNHEDTTITDPIGAGIDTVEPPASGVTIPGELISRLVSVLSSDECSSRAFRSILQALSDLRDLPGVYDAIKAKTLKDGRKFRIKAVNDLRALHSGDSNTLDLEVLGKFASGAAAQTKLLRVVTFVDYLLDTRKIQDRDERKATYGELIGLFKGINFYNAWNELSLCLDLIATDDYKFSTALLPLVECITVISKHVLNAEKQANSYSGWLRTKFTEFSLQHRKILNHLVRMNPKLLSGSFAVLSKDSRVLDFDNKLKYFNRRAIEEKERLGPHLTRLQVHRKQVFLDTYRSLFYKQPNEIKTADIQVTFHGEDAVDAGGVTREWYETLSKEIFNPDYALFLPTSSGSNVFQPNPTSYVNPEHLSFFKFVGRIIGKAVYDGRLMSCYFNRAMYKYLLQRPIDLSDMESVDQEYYKSLVWMLNNDITDILTETFSVEEDKFGETVTVDLVENGSEIPVTEENKQEYVKLIVEYKLVGRVKQQLDALAQGFIEMIPEKIRPVFFELFDEREIELLVCGLPEIDLDDWRDNTSYQNYNGQSPQIKWFWTAVSSFDNEQRAKLLQYATGTSKVPVGGFSQLETSNNAPKFSIVRDFGSNSRLPSAHTCTNQIDLPLYDNYQQLRAALLKAITESSSGFGFA